jgi:hypothetical protein
MTRKAPPPPSPARRLRGFEAASSLIAGRLKGAGEKRGFAVARMLTHWAEIVGDDLAAATRPLRIGYGREGFGATLTVAVQGAMAPVVEMQKARIRDRVNASLGHTAVSRVVLTQAAEGGFAEAQAPFAAAPRAAQDPAVAARAAAAAADVRDETLRDALETLARNVLSRPRT